MADLSLEQLEKIKAEGGISLAQEQALDIQIARVKRNEEQARKAPNPYWKRS